MRGGGSRRVVAGYVQSVVRKGMDGFVEDIFLLDEDIGALCTFVRLREERVWVCRKAKLLLYSVKEGWGPPCEVVNSRCRGRVIVRRYEELC